jgi:hypothetical protein
MQWALGIVQAFTADVATLKDIDKQLVSFGKRNKDRILRSRKRTFANSTKYPRQFVARRTAMN